MLMQIVHTLTELFGCLALLILVVSGIVLMVSPKAGHQLLKRAAVSIGLSVLGTMLLQAFCSAYRHCNR